MSSPNSPRIALLIHAMFGGGAERLMSQLAGRWAKDYEVHLVTWADLNTDQYQVPDSVRRHGLNELQDSNSLLRGIWANYRRVRKLRRKLQEIAPELILSFSDQMNIASLEASRGLDIPHWISEHSNPQQQQLSTLWERWRKRSYPTCTGCVVLTDGIAAWMQNLVPSEIRVIPPSIPSVEPSSQMAESKQVLFVGRLSPEKRVDLLLDAWSRVEPQHPDWSLHIVGEGALREQLELQAVSLKRVQFHGWCDDPIEFYRQAGLFVLSSNYEGFPVSLLEAMSHGAPCLSTRCSDSIDSLATRSPAPLAVAPVDDVELLANQLNLLLDNEEARQELSQAGRSVAQTFTWQRVGPLWDAILTDTLKSV